jgi:hypothetical protein
VTVLCEISDLAAVKMFILVSWVERHVDWQVDTSVSEGHTADIFRVVCKFTPLYKPNHEFYCHAYESPNT